MPQDPKDEPAETLTKQIHGNEEIVFDKDLPRGWITTKLRNVVLNPKTDIVDGPFGSNLKASEYVDGGIPLIRLQNIDRSKFIDQNIKYITRNKAESLKRHSFKTDDIVITKLGKPVGKACLVPEYLPYGIIVADIVRMRLSHNLISKQFLVYEINSQQVITQFENHVKGTTRPRVNLTMIRDFQIKLPPLNEQKRIVSKIESIFAKIDVKLKILLSVFMWFC